MGVITQRVTHTAMLFVLITMWITTAYSKNVLRLRVDTVSISSTPKDVVLNVYYKIDSTHPYDFNGFNLRLRYDNTKMQCTQVFFDGTATQQASFKIQNTRYAPDQVSVVVLGNPGSKAIRGSPILFTLRFQTRSGMQGMAGIDSAYFELTDSSGIDEVAIEGGGITYRPPPVKRISIDVSSPATTVAHDSTFQVPVEVSSLTDGRITAGRLAFGIDTGVFELRRVLPGALLDASDSVSIDSTDIGRYRLSFMLSDTSKPLSGAGTLFLIELTAKRRLDTLCSSFLLPELESLNEGSLVDSVRYQFRDICVEGFRPQDTLKRVEEEVVNVCVLPNPARDYCEFRTTDNGLYEIRVFNPLGVEIFRSLSPGATRWTFMGSVPAGMYQAVVRRLDRNHERQVISIAVIH